MIQPKFSQYNTIQKSTLFTLLLTYRYVYSRINFLLSIFSVAHSAQSPAGSGFKVTPQKWVWNVREYKRRSTVVRIGPGARTPVIFFLPVYWLWCHFTVNMFRVGWRGGTVTLTLLHESPMFNPWRPGTLLCGVCMLPPSLVNFLPQPRDMCSGVGD